MTNLASFVHNGITVELDQDFINLTKLWEMAGRPESQTPAKWRLLPSTDTLINQVLDNKGLRDPGLKQQSHHFISSDFVAAVIRLPAGLPFPILPCTVDKFYFYIINSLGKSTVTAFPILP